MKAIKLLLLTFLFIIPRLLSATGKLSGKIIDSESGETIPFANVLLEKNGIQKGGTTTDFDGNYSISPIVPGEYDVSVSYVGYAPKIIKGVLINSGKTTRLDIKLQTESKVLEEDVVVYAMPLIDPDNTSTGSNLSGNALSFRSSGIGGGGSRRSRKKSGNINLKGSRADATQYFMNGVKLLPGEMPDEASGDQYKYNIENQFIKTQKEAFSTFSIDADGASYANMRRFIMSERIMPPQAAIRAEELINYFNLDYPHSNGKHPISLNGEISDCPWNKENKLIRIGIKGQAFEENETPPSNFVFLIDVSGSMSDYDKLELLKRGFIQFVDGLQAEDRISIVTYAGYAGVPLQGAKGDEKSEIRAAIRSLGSGGSTAGAEGILTAYKIAELNFIEGGNNRIILGTDGDFNVGISNRDSLVKMIESERENGIFLSVLGVGRGNLNDAMMEQLANKGNGTYEYIDNVKQLQKVFLADKSKFYPVAKDVKVQVKFNKKIVESYRLIGYENRKLEKRDFKDDKKDAGEIGANQSITALYEIVPAKREESDLKESTFLIHFRYKLPDEEESQEMELEVSDTGKSFTESSEFMRFTASVASYSMLLSKSKFKGASSYKNVLKWLDSCDLSDEGGFKKEFYDIVMNTRTL